MKSKALLLAFFFPLLFLQEALPSECLQNVHRLMSRVSARDFDAFMGRLPKKALSHPLAALDTQKDVIFEMEGRYFWGHLSSVTFPQGGRSLYLLKNFKGQIHLWDVEHLSRVKAYRPQKAFSPESIARIHPRRPSGAFIDRNLFLSLTCKHYHAVRTLPEFKKISRILNHGPQRLWQLRLFRRYLSHCALGGPLAEILALASYTLLPPDELPGRHLSNFTFGMATMWVMDQCLKTLKPRAHQNILLSTLGANTLANIYYELDIPGLWQPDFIDAYLTGMELKDAKDTVTDLPDFASGTLATISFAYLSSWLERTTWINRARLCR